MEEIDKSVQQAVKKRKSNGRNSPVIGDNGYLTKPGDNSRALADILEVSYGWPRVDTNSDSEVEQRIRDYFKYCIDKDIKPGVEGMAGALGISRITLWEWEKGKKRAEPGSSRANIIQKAKQTLAAFTEYLAQNGKINPVTAIFLLKNHFGYTDKQEIEIAPKPLGDAMPEQELQERIKLAAQSPTDTTEDF